MPGKAPVEGKRNKETTRKQPVKKSGTETKKRTDYFDENYRKLPKEEQIFPKAPVKRYIKRVASTLEHGKPYIVSSAAKFLIQKKAAKEMILVLNMANEIRKTHKMKSLHNRHCKLAIQQYLTISESRKTELIIPDEKERSYLLDEN